MEVMDGQLSFDVTMSINFCFKNSVDLSLLNQCLTFGKNLRHPSQFNLFVGGGGGGGGRGATRTVRDAAEDGVEFARAQQKFTRITIFNYAINNAPFSCRRRRWGVARTLIVHP